MKWFKDILTNPDGTSYSSKRIWGGIFSLSTLVYGFYYLFTKQTGSVEPMFIMAGMTMGFFGLTSVDLRGMLNTNSNINNRAD